MARDSFEVYYNQNGRWQLHASYEANQRDLAVEEARLVESKEGYATRVVRETFFPESNTTEEIVSWQSPKAKSMGDADHMFGPAEKPKPKQLKRPPPKPTASEAPRPAPRPSPQKATAGKPQAPVQRPKRRAKGLVGRVAMIAVTSVGIAALVAILVPLIALQLPLVGLRAPENQGGQLFIGTFVLVFFLAFLINLHRQFGLLALLRGQPKTRSTAPKAAPPTAKTRAFVQEVEFDQVEIEDLRAKIAAEDAELEVQEDVPQELDADLGAEVHGETQAPAPASLEPEPVAAVAAVAAPVAAPKPEPRPAEQRRAFERAPEPEKEKAPKTAPGEVEARNGFSKFIGEAMGSVNSDQLNAFSRFGLNLYLAGAASVIGQSKRLPRDTQLSMVKEGLQQAGNTAERAEAFCVELPTYGKNPRYAGMVAAGVKAMSQRLGGAGNAAAGIGALLNEWNLPEKRPTVPSVITFLFTDIVGSTEMTQRLGNAGAQKAVRAHNTAVRGAIQAKRGREVKHTGDGIMATFPDPPSAVTGAIQMQREIADHNAANPTLQVNVRIGVNVGEAVQEENDFFGAAVQMTARICDKATKGNVWVSQAIVDGCKGQKLGFIPRGRFEMKGIQGAKTLYEVGWTDAHRNELADL